MCIYICVWLVIMCVGLYLNIKKNVICLISPNHVIVVFPLIVFSGGGLSLLEMWLFQLPVGVTASLVESQQVSPFPSISLSFRIHVLSFSIAMYQTYRSTKGDMFNPVKWVSAQTLAFFSYFVVVFVIVLLSLWRPVQVAIFRVHEPWTCTCISSLLCFFTLIVFWPANALVVRRGKPS